MDHSSREIRYLRTSGPSALVELHWDVFPDSQLAPRPSQWNVETHALYLAMHGGRHLWQPLKHLCDLRDWFTHYATAFDWIAYFDLARRLRLERVAAAALALIEHIWGPDTISGVPAIARRSPAGLLRYVLAQPEATENLWAYHRLRLELLDTSAQRAGYAFRLLSPTRTELDFSRPGDFWQPWLKRGKRLAERAWRERSRTR
jgi:hypothetical protein